MADNITKEEMTTSYKYALASLKESYDTADTPAKIKLMNNYYKKISCLGRVWCQHWCGIWWTTPSTYFKKHG